MEALVSRTIDAVSAPFDYVRTKLWKLSAQTAWGRACLRSRGVRFETLVLGHTLFTLAVAVFGPLWLLLLGPLLLGVMHVASDWRYLWLAHAPKLSTLIFVPLVAMTALRTSAMLGGPYSIGLEVLLGLFAIAMAMLSQPLSTLQRLSIGLGLGLLGAVMLAFAFQSLVFIAHFHHLVAVMVWLYVAKSHLSRAQVLRILALLGLASAVLLSGVVDRWLLPAFYDSQLAGLHGAEVVRVIAPVSDPVMAVRWTAFFAFGQAMHYAIWLRFIPQSLDSRPNPPPMKRALHSAKSVLGTKTFVLFAVLTLAFPLWALLVSPTGARTAYLVAVIAHGWLEFTIIGALFAQRLARA